ncbi:amidohydrolase family protein [Aestuariirhabdus sp. Z084]|uniref:amidohydrolase family protein n=1 Tax=Aestuariirhabdus haliotis TaxID=2918751 RepID=UPI00201B359B|nr:amidohydrolase family protein [Aestuariirhabdus haliotis]MCL6415110.1 amidohydrolase family protein [Aestuariirhabdus haliotis]MCL6419042.1 amidohydrolase family protein [Aestuariirhabdus haliotis]
MFRTLAGPAPSIALPKGTIDCHMHLFDSRYPEPKEGPAGPAHDAPISDYQQLQTWLGIDRVVIVQGNAYHKDNRCTLDALAHYGDKARAVVAVDVSITDDELQKMTQLGVRGARIMDLLQGAVGLDEMLEVNARVQPFGWSLIIQFDGRSIVERAPLLEQIQGDYVIDHIGKFLRPVSPDSNEFHSLLRLIDRGNCYVKIAACYETSLSGHPKYDDVALLAKALIEHAPERVIWGTNWPHLMSQSAQTYPDDRHLVDLANSWAGSPANRQKLFVDNPARLYGFTS